MFNAGVATPNPDDYVFAFTPGKIGGYILDAASPHADGYVAHAVNIDYFTRRVVMLCHGIGTSGTDANIRMQFTINDNNQISGQIDSLLTGHLGDFSNLSLKTGCDA